jgi:biotin carboxyl carrier protein
MRNADIMAQIFSSREVDEIKKDELCGVIETASNAHDIAAPASGRIIKILREAGDAVSSEDVLATISTDL